MKSLIKYTTIFTMILFTIVMLNFEFIKSNLSFINNHLNFQINSEAKTIQSNNVDFATKKTNVSAKLLATNFLHTEDKQDNPIIYLTFDDGPSKHTKKILSILKKENVQATFFILQPNGKNHPELVKQTNEEGHALACHGVTHTIEQFYKTNTSPLKEMTACKNLIQDLTHVETNLVRVPYGSVPYLTKKQKSFLEKEGFFIWDWNVDSNDWSIRSSKQLIHHTIQQVEALHAAKKTPVILFHDTEVTANSLEQIIKSLKKLNFEFRVINEDYVPVQFHVK